MSLDEGERLDLNSGETGAFYEYDGNRPPGLDSILHAQNGTEYLELYIDDPAFGSPTGTILVKYIRTGLVNAQFTVRGGIGTLARSLKPFPDRQIISAIIDVIDDRNRY